MVTVLAMYTLQKVWLCAADCKLGYMNKTLFTLIAFDYLIFTFKVTSRGRRKIPDISWKLDVLSIFSIVTVGDSGTLLFPICYRQIA